MKVKKKSGKPFKSGLKIATVKDIIDHPLKPTGGDAYTFEEDDSCVSVSQCVEVLNNNITEIVDLYSKLTDEEKIELFLTLGITEIQEHFDVQSRLYDFTVKDAKGKYIIKRTIRAFSNRHANALANEHINALSENKPLEFSEMIVKLK